MNKECENCHSNRWKTLNKGNKYQCLKCGFIRDRWSRLQQKAAEIYFAGEDFIKLKQPKKKSWGNIFLIASFIVIFIIALVILIYN
jgi:hypothetical protein